MALNVLQHPSSRTPTFARRIGHQRADQHPIGRLRANRPPLLLVPALGFGAYLLTVAGLTGLNAGHLVSAVALVLVAAALGWWAELAPAAAMGAFGWLFWSGFVVHSHGQLGFTGLADVVIIMLLVVAGLFGSVLGRSRPPRS